MKPQLPVWIRVLAGCLAVIGLAGCGSQATAGPDYLPAVRVPSARAHLDRAMHLAKQWRNNASLIELKADVVSIGRSGPATVTFRFESPSESHLIYSVECAAQTCLGQEFEVGKAFIADGWVPIEFDDQMIDSLEAATVGLQNGGKRFLSVKDAIIWVRLGRDIPRDVGDVVWLAYHGSLAGEELGVVIDPYTGKVIRLEK
jgi:hypothetical protein